MAARTVAVALALASGVLALGGCDSVQKTGPETAQPAPAPPSLIAAPSGALSDLPPNGFNRFIGYARGPAAQPDLLVLDVRGDDMEFQGDGWSVIDTDLGAVVVRAIQSGRTVLELRDPATQLVRAYVVGNPGDFTGDHPRQVFTLEDGAFRMVDGTAARAGQTSLSRTSTSP